MASFNRIILVGYLGRDPELRYTPQGMAVCNFSIATNERRKDSRSGEMQDVTTWFKVTLWGRKAEVANQYLSKGKPVYIEGSLRQEEWTDQRDGTKRTSLVVNATDMQFLGTKGDEVADFSSSPSAQGQRQSEGDDIEPPHDNDIPF